MDAIIDMAMQDIVVTPTMIEGSKVDIVEPRQIAWGSSFECLADLIAKVECRRVCFCLPLDGSYFLCFVRRHVNERHFPRRLNRNF
jgi:hypothetical protein